MVIYFGCLHVILASDRQYSKRSLKRIKKSSTRLIASYIVIDTISNQCILQLRFTFLAQELDVKNIPFLDLETTTKHIMLYGLLDCFGIANNKYNLMFIVDCLSLSIRFCSFE